jgi:hypothetical protein
LPATFFVNIFSLLCVLHDQPNTVSFIYRYNQTQSSALYDCFHPAMASSYWKPSTFRRTSRLCPYSRDQVQHTCNRRY